MIDVSRTAHVGVDAFGGIDRNVKHIWVAMRASGGLDIWDIFLNYKMKITRLN